MLNKNPKTKLLPLMLLLLLIQSIGSKLEKLTPLKTKDNVVHVGLSQLLDQLNLHLPSSDLDSLTWLNNN